MARIMKSPRVNVVVTPELIEEAVRGDSGHCMIAEAVKAAVPEARHVSVDLQTIRYSLPGVHARYTFLTPRIGQTALVRFDAGEEVEPFRMQLRNPHITAMSNRAAAERRQRELDEAGRTERQEEVREAHREVLVEARSRQRRKYGTGPKATKMIGKENNRRNGGGDLPRIEGGTPPPVGPLQGGIKGGPIPRGRRREYGIRALDRGSSLLLRDSGQGEEQVPPQK